jgi:hypothetical protein
MHTHRNCDEQRCHGYSRADGGGRGEVRLQEAKSEASPARTSSRDGGAPLLGQPEGTTLSNRAAPSHGPPVLQSPVLVHHTGPVSHVHFSPTAPHSIAASASVGVHVYKPKSSTKQKTISRFKDVAYSPQFRGENPQTHHPSFARNPASLFSSEHARALSSHTYPNVQMTANFSLSVGSRKWSRQEPTCTGLSPFAPLAVHLSWRNVQL